MTVDDAPTIPATGRADAVHAWSLDRTLQHLPLLDLPEQLRLRGYRTVQLCHFHLPHRDAGYLGELRAALATADVALDALLVDDGDLTHPDEGPRHEAWISDWVRDAEVLGARRARVVAGKTRTDTAQRDSSQALGRIAARAGSVRVVTENWFDVTADAADVTAVLEPLDDAVGLLVDLGNWTGPGKYAELAAVTRFAETCHAKAHWHGAAIDAEDYRRSVSTVLEHGYTGPFCLVYDADDADEWAGLDVQRGIVRELLA
ncbi:sugar phosphate isomerase/epimerase family protein [Kineococcus sp. DHX-1]|uniref:sugar phosphate isomerase/epimerase family protein n=1 Tax=Kineococcus sp. DHX-1 TaxID=3349638 RepID=UPI0036D436A5